MKVTIKKDNKINAIAQNKEDNTILEMIRGKCFKSIKVIDSIYQFSGMISMNFKLIEIGDDDARTSD